MKSIKLNAFLFIIVIMALTACQSAQPEPVNVEPVQPVPVEPQQPVPVEGFPTVDYGGGTAPALGPNPCDNPYVPAVEGATWTSTVSFGQVNMAQVDTITDVGSDAFLVETKAADTSVIVTWTCTPDGVLWLQSDGGMFSAVSQDATWSTDSFSGVTIPKEIQPGDSWFSSQVMTATDANGSSTTFTINVDYQAAGIESVTVPAGTFEAMRIDFIMNFSGAGNESAFEFSDWFVENVGLVKSTAQQTIGGSLSFSQELVSYAIP